LLSEVVLMLLVAHSRCSIPFLIPNDYLFRSHETAKSYQAFPAALCAGKQASTTLIIGNQALADCLTVSGSQVTVAGSQVTVAGSQVTVAGSQVTVAGSQVTVSGRQVTVAVRQLMVVGRQLTVVERQVLVARRHLIVFRIEVTASET
jgi:hypothetical protein